MALKRHKQNIVSSLTEVFWANGYDFLCMAFVSRSHGAQVIVRMRGLPHDATPQQVLEFFSKGEDPVQVLDGANGVLFVRRADGRATGDAFVLFAKEDDSSKALSRHRKLIGARCIELFRSTTDEIQQVVKRSSLETRASSTSTHPPKPIGVASGLGGAGYPRRSRQIEAPSLLQPYLERSPDALLPAAHGDANLTSSLPVVKRSSLETRASSTSTHPPKPIGVARGLGGAGYPRRSRQIEAPSLLQPYLERSPDALLPAAHGDANLTSSLPVVKRSSLETRASSTSTHPPKPIGVARGLGGAGYPRRSRQIEAPSLLQPYLER